MKEGILQQTLLKFRGSLGNILKIYILEEKEIYRELEIKITYQN
jgi:hypothetical protein